MNAGESAVDSQSESEIRYRTLFEKANDAIFTMDGEIFTECNPKTLEIYGCKSKEDIIGRSPWEFSPEIQPDGRSSKDKAQEMITSCVKGRDQRFYWKHSRLDGTEFDAEVSLNCVEFDGETIIQAIVRDITEQMERENHMRQDEELLKALLNAPLESAMLVGEGGRILAINDIAADRLGRSPDALVGSEITDYLPPTLVESRLKYAEMVVGTKKPVRFEDERDGRYFENSLYPVFDTDGEVLSIAVYAKDISERRRAEKALLEEKEFTDTALDAQMDTFFLFEPATGKAIRWNKAFNDVTGYTDEEIAGMPAPASYYSEEDLAEAGSFIQTVIDEGTGTIELELICKDGRRVPTEYQVSVIEDDSGEPKYMISIGRDITRRKESEMALMESEEKFHKLFETSPNVLVISNLEDGRIIDMNENGIRKLGYQRDEIIGKTRDQLAIVDPADVGTLVELIRRDGLYSGIELKAIAKDGTEKYGLFHGQLIEIGGKTYLFQTIVDLTERKEMEREIESYFEVSSDLVCMVDLEDYTFMKVNSSFHNILGYEETDLISRSILDIIHPRTVGKNLARIKEAMERGERSLRVEDLMMAKDGSTRWVAWTINPDPDKNILFASGRDITHRKEAEMELRRRLMRYRLEDGGTYLVKEKVSDRSLESLQDLLNIGLYTTVFSRTPEKSFRRSIQGEYDFHWLASRESEEAFSPDVEGIERTIEGLSPREAVLIDGIGYLSTKNGFDRTLAFVQEVRELAYLKDLIVIIAANPDAIDESQMRQLEIECEDLLPLHETMLSAQLMDVLRLIVDQHDKNISPTYLTLVEELRISRPTARKRVNQLTGLGYISETRKGKSKSFDLTEKGRSLFKR